MSIIWAGGEDIDFLYGAVPQNSTSTAYYRSAYARCGVAIQNTGNQIIKSTPWPSSVTGFWASWRCNNTNGGAGTAQNAGIGFCNSSTAYGASASPGLWIGTANNSLPAKLSIYSFNGSSFTSLASESGTSFSGSILHKFDVQVTNWGASATVNVYIDGVQIITWSGSLTGTGISNVNQIQFGYMGDGGSIPMGESEIIITDAATPTFNMSLMSLTPAALGNTHAWTGSTVANITGVSYSTASPFFTNSTSQQEDLTLGAIATGIYGIPAVVVSALLAISATSTPTTCGLGFYNTNTSTAGIGSQQSLTTGWTAYNQIDQTDPTNGGAAWSQTEFTSNFVQVALST